MLFSFLDSYDISLHNSSATWLCILFVLLTDRFKKAKADLDADRKNHKDVLDELEAMEASLETRKSKWKIQLKKSRDLVKTQFKTYMSRKGFSGKAIFSLKNWTLNLVGFISSF